MVWFDEGMVSKIIEAPDSEVYSEHSQTSKMKRFVEIANDFQSLTSILDVWQVIKAQDKFIFCTFLTFRPSDFEVKVPL